MSRGDNKKPWLRDQDGSVVAPQETRFLFALDPVGDPFEELTSAEERVVEEIVLNAGMNAKDILKQHGITMSPDEFFPQAKVQLYGRQLLRDHERSKSMLVTGTFANLMAMSFVDVVGLHERDMDSWTKPERLAVTDLKKKTYTLPDGTVVDEVEIKTAKMAALSKLMKALGIDNPDSKIIQRFLAATPEMREAAEALKENTRREAFELADGRKIEFDV